MFWEVGNQGLDLSLLRVNKSIHSEASFVLYSQNRFDLAYCDSEFFLEQIGRENASCIKYLCIEFPQFNSLNLHDITLEDNSSRVLAKIQSHCTRLATLGTSFNSSNNAELELDGLDNHDIAAQALALVNERFRGISSLQNIIVEMWKTGPSESIRNEMKNHGWTFDTMEFEEELDLNSGSEDLDPRGYVSDTDSDF